MRSHAKASSAGSDQRRAAGLGLTFGLLLAALLVLLSALFVTFAGATSRQRPFKEVFGSLEQPTFVGPATIGVDPTSGDVLVADSSAKTVSRFHPNGTPAPFAALGTNVIDGKEGPKPCVEEPASCDKTPQNGLEVTSNTPRQQIVVSPTSGDIYITQDASKLVDIFSTEGKYLGQLTAAGFKGFNDACGVAVDSSGAVYVDGSFGNTPSTVGIAKFVPSGNPPVNADNTAIFPVRAAGYPESCQLAMGAGPSAGSIFAVSFSGGLGHYTAFKVNKETGEFTDFVEGPDSIVLATADPTSGNPLFAAQDAVEAREFNGSNETAADLSSRFIVSQGGIRSFVAGPSGDVYLDVGSSNRVFVYGPPAIVPTVIADQAANVSGTKATLTGTVNAEGTTVSECFFEWGATTGYGNEAPCEGSIPADDKAHSVHANLTGLLPNGHTYHFRVVATNENGTEESADSSFKTADTVDTDPASAVGPEAATLNGTLRPEGEPFGECFFEYGIATNAGFEETAPCNPSASAIEADFSPHAVSAAITGLQRDTTYRFRAVATNAEGTFKGGEQSFTTLGAPLVGETRALDATQSSVSVEGKVNPSGFATSYRFEWGSTSSYGRQAPAEFEPNLGSGTEPVRVNAKLTGLSTGSIYHYRIVATSSAGTTAGPDQTFETLDSCGLPEDRCFELVSRREAGPVVIPGESLAQVEIHAQAATDGPGALAYVTEAGYPEATKGAEVLYRGTRGPGGWSSAQISTPIVAPNEQNGGGSGSGHTKFLANDLSCGFAESPQPLSADPATRLVIEDGGTNLYRHNPDGSYTAVSYLAPENSEGAESTDNYFVAGASQDCGKVLFSTQFRYPGIPGVLGPGESRLYEWEEGTLRNAGIVPGPSGEVAVAATAGTTGNSLNTVSEDGSRVFLNATRQTSPNPAEVGKTAVFVREDGTTTRDLSLSETSTPDKGATYRWATPDGSRVFFTANAGLTDESSPEGTDLYEYDLESDELTDLTPYQGEGGAGVAGFIGVAEDGSRAYFASANQLVPGKGPTLAENQNEETLSIYGASNGEFSFVGTFSKDDLDSVVLQSQNWTSRVSPDGRYLLFESSTDVTGYESGGWPEAYLYDAHGGSEGTTCVSCRQDGRPSVAGEIKLLYEGRYPVLNDVVNAANDPAHPIQFLTVHGGKPQIFFTSLDKLAPGAVEGQNNVYEWSHHQVFRLTSAREGQQLFRLSGKFAVFTGASEDGSDVYLVSPENLNWEDGDERLSVYDARIGGGFPEPEPEPEPCDATTEGACQGSAQGDPAVPGAASAAFSGPGNPPASEAKQKKHKHKKRYAKKKHKRHAKRARHANANRRAGK